MRKLIRDVFLLSVVALLFAWHFRDKAGVQNQRPAVEYALKRAGMELETVRRYWPLEGDGADLLKIAKEAAAPYNPIEGAQKAADAANRAQRSQQDALERIDK